MYVTYLRSIATNLIDYQDLIHQLYSDTNTIIKDKPQYSKNYLATATLISNDAISDLTWQQYNRINQLVLECKKITDPSAEYSQFMIPKSSGGMRTINAPSVRLADLQREIVRVFESVLKVKYHNNAFAYVKGRGTKDALVRHQLNDARWFLKLDIKEFFPSCNKEFILRQLSNIYPFNKLSNTLPRIIDVCMLNDGLPQGAPTSPMLSNLVMLSIDYKLNAALFQVNKTKYTVTRYADDLLISSKYAFKFEDIVKIVNEVFESEQVPFALNNHKTRYASFNGSNWNLGLMFNNQGNVTVGHRRKKRVKSLLYNMFRDNAEDIVWTCEQCQAVIGEYAYVVQVEPDALKEHVRALEHGYGTTLKKLTKKIIRN